MADEVLWELTLELRDGAAASFRATMSERSMPSAEVNGKTGRYGWSLSADGMTASIFFRADEGPVVCWAGDWADAERHLTAIGEDLPRRIAELGRPTNLISFDASEVFGWLAPLAEPKPIVVLSAAHPRHREAARNESRKAAVRDVA